MQTIPRFLLSLAILCAALPFATAASLKYESYAKRPKLVVVVVIDQFRADYLTRFNDRFLPAKKPNGDVGGFRYLMANGAYFPMAHFDFLQNMTCPGHSAILTGSTPARSGIPLNDWYDATTGQKRYCVSDDVDGLSPRTLQGTTVGDELKNAGYDSKVVALALKDRAAILLGGHRADLSFWLGPNGEWATSTYYAKALPEWLAAENARLKKSSGESLTWTQAGFNRNAKKGTPEALAMPYGVQITVDAALAAVTNLKLGRSKATDLLALSLSTHDLQGHLTGPNSPEMEDLTLNEDREIARLLNGIRKTTPLSEVVVALTADHGVAPLVDDLTKNKMDAGFLEPKELLQGAEADLVKAFGHPKTTWLGAIESFNFYFTKTALEKVDRVSLESRLKKYLLTLKGVDAAFSRSDVESGFLPPGENARQIVKSYAFGRSGDVIFIPKPFYMETGKAANHMTGYSYDRSVPILLAGPHIKKGVYADQIETIDLAPTLSFLTGTIVPAQSEGHILSQAIGD